MRGQIDINGKEYEAAANAASPYIYKQIFREDFLQKIQEKEPDVEILQKMFFVMVNQAEKTTTEALNLTIDDYIKFLEQFDPMEILNATSAISEFYFKQTEKTSAPKEKAG